MGAFRNGRNFTQAILLTFYKTFGRGYETMVQKPCQLNGKSYPHGAEIDDRRPNLGVCRWRVARAGQSVYHRQSLWKVTHEVFGQAARLEVNHKGGFGYREKIELTPSGT